MTLHTALLLAATVLFLLSCPRPAFKFKGWMLPLGLACFSAAFFLEKFVT